MNALSLWVWALATFATMGSGRPFFESQLLFAPQTLHNHASCVVECPNGDLLACWYRGSGERGADDVQVLGARLRKREKTWSTPFVLADTPGFPDCNPCMIVDPQKRLWLFWVTILDNHWESALLKVKTSSDFTRTPGPPQWQSETVVPLKPGPEFPSIVARDLDRQWQPYLEKATPEQQTRLHAYLNDRHTWAGQPLATRLGWMPRPHPYILDGRRLILPLYSDRFDFALMAITDDWGATWRCSEPLVGPGNVQPSLARRKDGTLVAYFRDNGPPPQRIMESESKDRGITWTLAHDIDLPNPGSGLEVVALQSGRWLLVGNDTERGRQSLAIWISEDEGRTWPILRHLEQDPPGVVGGSYSYPSILQAKDGTIHVTYSYQVSAANAAREGKGETIKHVAFNEDWLLSAPNGR